ncbi:von Willebrand factor A domain containing 3A [Cichlidogyrus casuarinus]|uniref:von Willebrand factor A domain containing 3A n=1 Tax=Cichlidogyrus casuarinus TaxID=1844966 RepID=A0ABD2Q7N1_9PLAT
MAFGRAETFKQNLVHLLSDQIEFDPFQNSFDPDEAFDMSDPPTLYVATYGSKVSSLWKNPQVIKTRVIREAALYLGEQIEASGGSNLLTGIKHMMQVGRKHFDYILVISGSYPDQCAHHIISYMEQAMLGQTSPVFHFVSYDCPNPVLNQFLAHLSTLNPKNIFHCYSAADNASIFLSSEVSKVQDEMKEAQKLLELVQSIRKTAECEVNRSETVVSQIKSLVIGNEDPNSNLAEEVAVFDRELNICEGEPQSTSENWLSRNGLKAKKLSLYQVLAPNAFEKLTKYVRSIDKTVSAQIYDKFMSQVEWPDGSVKNVHVDFAVLFEYQKQLSLAVSLYEKRVHWLTLSSRSIFGTVVENRVCFVLDLCAQNVDYLVHIKYSIRRLLEQQILGKTHFNFITLGGRSPEDKGDNLLFRKSLVPVNKQNLQEAWQWIRRLSCGGSRNVLEALKRILEGNIGTSESFHTSRPEGIYLFTSGIPDQECTLLSAYLEQTLFATVTKLHIVLYNVDDYDIVTGNAIPARYANITKTADSLRRLANSTKGRFHWFRETGIIDSDDIRLLLEEIDVAVRYSKKCLQLVSEAKRKGCSDGDEAHSKMLKSGHDQLKKQSNLMILGPPKSTVLTEARKLTLQQKKYEAQNVIPKTLAYRNGIPACDPMKSVKVSRSSSAISKSAAINQEEEALTSKQWINKYGLKSLGMDLFKLVSGSACTHEYSFVKSTNSRVEAKYCSGLFPIFNVRGTMRHLHYTVDQLQNYIKRGKLILKRYCRRLEWLLSGSRRIFGVLAERRVVIVVDISGSMVCHMEEIKESLKLLIWEQIFARNILFNVIAFNDKVHVWNIKQSLALPDETSCHDCIAWIDQLAADGGTSTAEATLMGIELLTRPEKYWEDSRKPDWLDPVDSNFGGIYVLSDGKPDKSCVSTFAQIESSVNEVLQDKKVKKNSLRINTICFNCDDEASLDFMKKVAKFTKGRFWRAQSVETTAPILIAIEALQNRLKKDCTELEHPVLPKIDSDDVKELSKEISNLRRYIDQSLQLINIYISERSNRKKTTPE